MKKLLLLLLLPFFISCTVYNQVYVSNDTPLLMSASDGATEYLTIPTNELIYVKGSKQKKFRKIKYKQYTGYAVYPAYSTSPSYTTNSTPSNNYSPRSSGTTNYRSASSSSSSTGAPKTVNVKGYTRKDGTYVRPHTRSAPRSKH